MPQQIALYKFQIIQRYSSIEIIFVKCKKILTYHAKKIMTERKFSSGKVLSGNVYVRFWENDQLIYMGQIPVLEKEDEIFFPLSLPSKPIKIQKEDTYRPEQSADVEPFGAVGYGAKENGELTVGYTAYYSMIAPGVRKALILTLALISLFCGALLAFIREMDYIARLRMARHGRFFSGESFSDQFISQ